MRVKCKSIHYKKYNPMLRPFQVYHPKGRAEILALKIYDQKMLIKKLGLEGCRDLQRIAKAKSYLKVLEGEYDAAQLLIVNG